MSDRTYTVDEIKIALKGAGLPSYVRHAVYSNLPPKADPAPDLRPVEVSVGCAVDNVYLTDIAGNVHQGTMIVAAASGDSYAKRSRRITFWLPAALVAAGSYRTSTCAVVARYENVQINNRPLGGVK